MAEQRIPIPRVKNPVALRWGAATLVAGLAMSGYSAVTQPQNRLWTALALAVILLPLLVLGTRTQWLDPESGTVGQTLLGRWQLSQPLSPELPVALVDVGTGVLALRLGRFPGRIFVPLLRLDVYDHTAQDPATLRVLAEQITRHAPARGELADRLRRQADHLAAGGTPEASPLAPLVVTHTVNPLPGRSRRHD